MKQAVGIAAAIALACSMAFGQAASDKPKLEFEVATIKPAPPIGNGPIRIGSTGGPNGGDPARITYHNSTLRDLLVAAYGVKRNQISGGPEWLDSERFDITAKIPEGTGKDDVKVMLQNLLADRFKAEIHRETKELPIYALIVGKSGPKLKASTVPDPPPAPKAGEGAGPGSAPSPPPPPGVFGPPKRDADGCPQPPEQMAGRGVNFMMMTPTGACLVSTGQTVTALADMLSNQLDRPVVDMTELKGKFDFKLRFDPGSTGMGRGRGGMFVFAGPPPGGGPGGPGGAAQPPEEREPAPSIFSAMQDQLGLKLDPRKGPVDLLVIDHIEKTPTEN
jgi:uncharacterized protein (TIGR03435 family)